MQWLSETGLPNNALFDLLRKRRLFLSTFSAADNSLHYEPIRQLSGAITSRIGVCHQKKENKIKTTVNIEPEKRIPADSSGTARESSCQCFDSVPSTRSVHRQTSATRTRKIKQETKQTTQWSTTTAAIGIGGILARYHQYILRDNSTGGSGGHQQSQKTSATPKTTTTTARRKSCRDPPK